MDALPVMLRVLEVAAIIVGNLSLLAIAVVVVGAPRLRRRRPW